MPGDLRSLTGQSTGGVRQQASIPVPGDIRSLTGQPTGGVRQTGSAIPRGDIRSLTGLPSVGIRRFHGGPPGPPPPPPPPPPIVLFGGRVRIPRPRLPRFLRPTRRRALQDDDEVLVQL